MVSFEPSSNRVSFAEPSPASIPLHIGMRVFGNRNSGWASLLIRVVQISPCCEWRLVRFVPNTTIILGLACADTEMEAEVEPSLETEQRLAQEEAARAEADRRREQELAAMAQVRTWNHDDMQSV